MLSQSRVAAALAASSSPCFHSWRNSVSLQLRRLATTKDPWRPKSSDDKQQQNSPSKANSDTVKPSSNVATGTSTTGRTSRSQRNHPPETPQQRSKPTRRKDWENDYGSQQSTPKALPVVQPSIYYYCTQSARPLGVETKGSSLGSRRLSRLVLPVMNASALLDPLKYCKTSSRLSQTRGVTRSISGTDAARRLLRGKKEFILAARSLKQQPALLEGHGVPPQLFQHCIDMADALLLQYSPDVVECTFHNYNYVPGRAKLPNILRIRR